MRLSENFDLAELTKSQAATRLGVLNQPTANEVKSLQYLVDTVLQPARDALGPIIINSGFRSEAVNRAIGGSPTSQHCKGEAADIEALNLSNLELAKWIVKNCEFDQVILEGYDPKDPRAGWVHVSVKPTKNRGESLLAIFPLSKPTVYQRVDFNAMKG